MSNLSNLFIAATASSPEVDFRFDQHLLSLKGESYPENAAAFWGNVIDQLKQYLAQCGAGERITVNVALAYFNSSSTKMLFALFEALNAKAGQGSVVTLNWCHDAEDDTIYEFGQELHEDFSDIAFFDHAVET